MDSLGKRQSMAGWHGFWCKISTLGKLRLLEMLLSQIKYDTVRCRSMLNGTDVVIFVDKIEWQTAFSTFVNGAIAIGLVTVLIALAIGAICLISRIVKFPISDMFALARDLAKDRINQYKASDKKPEPFCLSMLGIKIEAHGIRGKIMFIALLSSMAALVGSALPNEFSLFDTDSFQIP